LTQIGYYRTKHFGKNVKANGQKEIPQYVGFTFSFISSKS